MAGKLNFISREIYAQIEQYQKNHNQEIAQNPNSSTACEIAQKVNDICNEILTKIREKIEKNRESFPYITIVGLTMDQPGLYIFIKAFENATQIKVAARRDYTNRPNECALIPHPPLDSHSYAWALELNCSLNNVLLYPYEEGAIRTSSQDYTTIESSDEKIISFPTKELRHLSLYFAKTKTKMVALNYDSAYINALWLFVNFGIIPDSLKNRSKDLVEISAIARELEIESLVKYAICLHLQMKEVRPSTLGIKKEDYTDLLITAVQYSFTTATEKLKHEIDKLMKSENSQSIYRESFLPIYSPY